MGQEKLQYTILGLGDSITEGGADSYSYPCSLWGMLSSDGYQVDFIGPKQKDCCQGKMHHAGYSGQTVEFIETHIDSIYREFPADIILLHSGHNHFAEEEPVAGMIITYKSIINKIKAVNPNAIIMMAQVINSGKLPKYSYIPELNKEIAIMVREYNDPKLILVDQCTPFDWQKHTVEDKVHPNREGGELMAKIWFDVLVKVLPAPTQ